MVLGNENLLLNAIWEQRPEKAKGITG